MLIGIGIIILGVILDQVTKYLVVLELKGNEPITIIDKFFYLSYTENTGGAWGMMSGRMWIFIIITLIAFGFFAYMMKYFDLKDNKIYSIAMILLVIGTIGNFIDRLFRGYVVDFLDFYIFKYDFPVFNIADICLTVGVTVLLIDIMFGKSGHLMK